MENKFIVGSQGDLIVIGLPFRTARMSKSDALELAAWLVALAEDKDGDFDKILNEVKNS
jgi:hypothetical protein